MSDKPWPPEGAVHRIVTIVNQKGLHARAAAAFAKTAGRYKADVKVRRGEHTVSGLSIMGLMMLAASPGTDIEIAATGVDADAAVAALENLVALRFGED